MRNLLRVLMSTLLIGGFIATQLLAHGGRTDSRGGHNNRKTGGYHYHNAGYVHDANNPYQNHTTCGICPTSKSAGTGKESTKAKEDTITGEKKEIPKEGYFVGSAKSNKYHNPSCTWAKRIKSENLVTFETRKAAQDRGYVPCKVCNP